MKSPWPWLLTVLLPILLVATTSATAADQTIFEKSLIQRRPDVIVSWINLLLIMRSIKTFSRIILSSLPPPLMFGKILLLRHWGSLLRGITADTTSYLLFSLPPR